jgi:ADP-heptose:LPS heptosyltransferase
LALGPAGDASGDHGAIRRALGAQVARDGGDPGVTVAAQSSQALAASPGAEAPGYVERSPSGAEHGPVSDRPGETNPGRASGPKADSGNAESPSSRSVEGVASGNGNGACLNHAETRPAQPGSGVGPKTRRHSRFHGCSTEDRVQSRPDFVFVARELIPGRATATPRGARIPSTSRINPGPPRTETASLDRPPSSRPHDASTPPASVVGARFIAPVHATTQCRFDTALAAAATANPHAASSPLDPAWAAVRRILLVRLDNLGDVIVTSPPFRALRLALPEARLTLLASPAGAQAGKLNPDLDGVIVYDAPWMDPWKTLPQDPARELAMVERLRREQFDAAVIFGSFRQSALPAAYLCYLAGIPLRLGASLDGAGSLLTTRHKHPDRPMHEAERGQDLLSAVGIPPVPTPLVLRVPDDARRDLAGRAPWPEGTGPRVVVHAGCSMPARTYPWEGFAEIAARLASNVGASVLVTGDRNEKDLVARVVAAVPAAVRGRVAGTAGDLPFAGFCALIEGADLVVTNNTGPSHIAAALGTPVVTLFAWTNPPHEWGPWMVRHRLLLHDVPCKLCYARACPTNHLCLRGISPGRVVAEAASLLAEATDNDTSVPIHPIPIDVSVQPIPRLADGNGDGIGDGVGVGVGVDVAGDGPAPSLLRHPDDKGGRRAPRDDAERAPIAGGIRPFRDIVDGGDNGTFSGVRPGTRP